MFKIKYYSFLFKIKDKEIRKQFYEYTKFTYKEWDNTTYLLLNKVIKLSFKEFNESESKHLKIFLLTLPEVWILYSKDLDFKEYFKPFINEIIKESENDTKIKSILKLF